MESSRVTGPDQDEQPVVVVTVRDQQAPGRLSHVEVEPKEVGESEASQVVFVIWQTGRPYSRGVTSVEEDGGLQGVNLPLRCARGLPVGLEEPQLRKPPL